MLTTEDSIQAEVTDEMLDDFFAQAIARHQAEDWQAAETFYQKILAVIPGQANVNYNLGMLKLQLNQTHESLAYFENALAADESEPKYWISYIETLIQTGNKKKAVDVLMAGLEQGLYGDEVNVLVNQLTQSVTPQASTNSPEVVNADGPVVVNSPVVVNAVAAVESGSKAQPTNSIQSYLNNPRVNKILALQQAGKHKQAKKEGKALLRILPDHPILLTCMGGIAISEQRFDDGITLLEQSLKVVAEQTTALSYLCIAYTQLGKPELAITYADQALELNPSYIDAYVNKASALSTLKRHYEAATCLKQAVELNANDAVTQCLYGEELRILEQYDTALHCFNAGFYT